MHENNFTLEFIEVSRFMPALWNIQCKDYSNRNLKCQQYETLLKKYQENFPEANKKEMYVKINSLRTCYRRELRRINALEKSGAGLSEENESTLFYFEAMEFSRDWEQPCTSRSSMLTQNQMSSNMLADGKFAANKRKTGIRRQVTARPSTSTFA